MFKRAIAKSDGKIVSGDVSLRTGVVSLIFRKDGKLIAEEIIPDSITPKELITNLSLSYLKSEAKKDFKDWTKLGLEFLFVYDLPVEIELKVKKAISNLEK